MVTGITKSKLTNSSPSQFQFIGAAQSEGQAQAVATVIDLTVSSFCRFDLLHSFFHHSFSRACPTHSPRRPEAR